MDYRNDLEAASCETTASVNTPQQGFVAYPAPIFCLLTPEEMVWQQQVYRRALEQARAAASGLQKFTFTLTPEAWN